MINQTLPIITTAIDNHIPHRVPTCGGTHHARTTPTKKELITDAACSSARVIWTPVYVSRMGRDNTTTQDRTIAVRPPWENELVLIGDTTIYPTCGIMGSQEFISKHGSTGSVEIGDIQKFHTSIDGNLAENGDSTPISSKVIKPELSHDSSADIYLICRVNFTINAVRNEAPDFMHLGLPAVNTLDELRSFGTPATRVGRPKDRSNWSTTGHIFGEVSAVGMSGTRSQQKYSYKTDFETRR